MGILDLLFPKFCFGCGGGDSYICQNCLDSVPHAKAFCPVCKKPSIDGVVHFKCKSKLGLDGLITLWRYEGVIKKAILGIKYKFVEDAARELAGKALIHIKAENFILDKNSVLVPIPLHKSRERWRGFNQSDSIGKIIAGNLGLKYIPDLLIRKTKTKSQTELDMKDRGENVRGVFALNPDHLVPSPQYLILFDDVWTTGATVKEAAKVFKRAGVEKVWGLTVAS